MKTFLLCLISATALAQPAVRRSTPAADDPGLVVRMAGTSGGGLTDAELRAAAVPVSGSLTCTGPLTDAQLRASAVPVSGTFFQATQPISAASLPLPTGAAQEHTTAASPHSCRISDGAAFLVPLTDTQLRATPVPVSGTVTVGTFPDNEPINIAQINGVTPLMGSGATGTGSHRVTPATDSPTFGTANGSIPAQSQLSSGRAVAYGSSPTAVTAGNNAPVITDLEGIPYVNMGHPRSVFCQMAAGTGTTLAELTGCAAVASNSYYIKSIVMTGGIATAATVPALIRSGTGSNCATGTVTWATCWHGAAGSCVFYFDPPIKVTQAHAICHIDATAGTKSVMLTAYIAP